MAVGRSKFAGFAALLAVALLALVASSCGDGQTPGAGGTPGAGETPQAEGTQDGDGALQELSELARGAGDGVASKVTYAVTTGLIGQAFEGSWVLIQKPPNLRFEFISTATGEELRTIIINAGDESYFCTSAAGQESCLEVAISEADERSAPFSPLFNVPQEVAAGIESITSVRKSQRTLAGVDATCFTVESVLIDLPEGEICFSDEGILLLLRGLGFTFEATSVSTDVSDEDFEPPFEVIGLP